MIDIGQNFYAIPSLTRQVTSRLFLYLSFYNVCLWILWWTWIMFGMVIETGPKIPNSVHDLMVMVMVTDLEFLYKSFVLNFLQYQFFAKPSMDFINVWHDDKTLSKILLGAIPIPVTRTLRLKILDFAKLQYVSPGFRCRVITGSLMRLY